MNKNSAESQFECLCNDGFIGKYCTIRLIDTCLAKPCENNGICSNITVFNQPNKVKFKTFYVANQNKGSIEICFF